MQINIKDDQGLGMALMMEHYSRTEVQEAKNIIHKQFKDAATIVFTEVLGKTLPETIVVDMALNDNEELNGEKSSKLASFNPDLSRMDYLVFIIREITVKNAMKQNDDALFKSTVIHEMIHAADLPVLIRNNKLFDDLLNKIYANASDFFGENSNNGLVALLKTLQVFEHYRAEGIAILGEHLLTKRRFKSFGNSLDYFRAIYNRTIAKSRNWTLGSKSMGEIFDDKAYEMAYLVAPSVLLLVLSRRGEVGKELTVKALEGLGSGNYELTDEEAALIIRSSLSLSLFDYIQGVVGLGENVAPAKPFLAFCGQLQREWERDNIEIFSDFLSQPQSKDMFNAAMQQILGCTMTEQEIDDYYMEFCEHPFEESLYPQMRAKVDKLYEVMKNVDDDEKKHIAKWALTYLFDEQDVIHDDIKGLGYVDDMAVIDYALGILAIE